MNRAYPSSIRSYVSVNRSNPTSNQSYISGPDHISGTRSYPPAARSYISVPEHIRRSTNHIGHATNHIHQSPTKKAAHKRGIPAYVQLLLVFNPCLKSFHHRQSSQLHKQTTH